MNWAREANGDLTINWVESGGPPVQPPTRKGFGTTIIGRSIPYDLGGEVTIDYPVSGVVATFRIPERHVSNPRDVSGPAISMPKPFSAPHLPMEPILEGRKLLLVEDSLIIALDAEDILTRLGASDVSTSATVESAYRTINEGKPDLAILDINLGDHTSYAVADRLLSLGVPFLFATGYGEQAQLPPAHRDRLVVQKPYTFSNLARAIRELLESEMV
jgi:CheY-like chemotaxis protein